VWVTTTDEEKDRRGSEVDESCEKMRVMRHSAAMQDKSKRTPNERKGAFDEDREVREREKLEGRVWYR
jgi:hypothetical protein